jgi:TetR/AcrR family transcriptional repressor of mexJK operon
VATAIKRRARTGRAGRPTVNELERRKARVLEVATQLFIQDGYAGANLVDIADKAGVATRTVYEHFGDKEQIFRQVIFSRDNAPKLRVPRATVSDSLFEALMRVGKYAISMSRDQKTIDMMRLMTAEQNRFPDLIKKVALASFNRFFSNVEQVFIDLSLLGRIPDGDHMQSARFFVDFILGASPLYTYTHWIEFPFNESEIKAKVELYIVGRFGASVLRVSHKAGRLRLVQTPRIPVQDEST